ncbi:divergent PAP2 family protein [Candidatus Woesearchaeota archaeon]|jgi:acid phosphatase family membrane protein YuiD|nr:divergent PAP2 family protein [Candidatus Woesearchaeota archaeon]
MILELIQNKIVISCFLAWIITQTSKGIIIGFKKKKFKWKYLLATGHMPSSHAGIVSSLVAAVYLNQGLTSLFAVSFVFALVVMRDSFGSRFLIGEHAKVINKLAKTHLKEVTGHRFKEVIVGSMLGILVSNIIFYL